MANTRTSTLELSSLFNLQKASEFSFRKRKSVSYSENRKKKQRVETPFSANSGASQLEDDDTEMFSQDESVSDSKDASSVQVEDEDDDIEMTTERSSDSADSKDVSDSKDASVNMQMDDAVEIEESEFTTLFKALKNANPNLTKPQDMLLLLLQLKAPIEPGIEKDLITKKLGFWLKLNGMNQFFYVCLQFNSKDVPNRVVLKLENKKKHLTKLCDITIKNEHLSFAWSQNNTQCMSKEILEKIKKFFREIFNDNSAELITRSQFRKEKLDYQTLPINYLEFSTILLDIFNNTSNQKSLIDLFNDLSKTKAFKYNEGKVNLVFVSSQPPIEIDLDLKENTLTFAIQKTVFLKLQAENTERQLICLQITSCFYMQQEQILQILELICICFRIKKLVDQNKKEIPIPQSKYYHLMKQFSQDQKIDYSQGNGKFDYTMNGVQLFGTFSLGSPFKSYVFTANQIQKFLYPGTKIASQMLATLISLSSNKDSIDDDPFLEWIFAFGSKDYLELKELNALSNLSGKEGAKFTDSLQRTLKMMYLFVCDESGPGYSAVDLEKIGKSHDKDPDLSKLTPEEWQLLKRVIIEESDQKHHKWTVFRATRSIQANTIEKGLYFDWFKGIGIWECHNFQDLDNIQISQILKDINQAVSYFHHLTISDWLKAMTAEAARVEKIKGKPSEYTTEAQDKPAMLKVLIKLLKGRNHKITENDTLAVLMEKIIKFDLDRGKNAPPFAQRLFINLFADEIVRKNLAIPADCCDSLMKNHARVLILGARFLCRELNNVVASTPSQSSSSQSLSSSQQNPVLTHAAYSLNMSGC